jgi:alpha-L-fucosidase
VVEGTFNDTKRKPFTGQDIRFTTKGQTLYAIALAWPGEKLVIKSLAAGNPLAEGDVTDVKLLGHEGKLSWSRTADGLVVTMPDRKPCDHAFVVEIHGLKLPNH